MPTIQRLSPSQIEILLDALDHYALLENTDRTPAEESAIADLALGLIDPADNAMVSEIVVLFSTGAADTADTSSTEPEATEPTDVEPDPNEEEDLEGEEDTEDDEPEEDEEDDDEEPDEEEDEAEEPALTEVTLQV